MASSGSRSNSHSRKNSANHDAALSSLRPRTNRLISGLDEPSNDSSSYSLIAASPFASLYSSRAPSPIPNQHPTRSPQPNLPQADYFSDRPSASFQGSDLSTSLSGLWGKSWTSLQGIASNVLGSDTSGELVKDKSPQRQRKREGASNTQPSKQWGPSTKERAQPGAGTQEDRLLQIRAQKRHDLLNANGAQLNLPARYKRRTSDDFSTSAPPGAHDDRDVLVYIHHVKRDDTLPGLSIKYNCPLATIKKANRMWSNDSIQVRRYLLIPVDSSAVRGRRVGGPDDKGQGRSQPTSAPADAPKTYTGQLDASYDRQKDDAASLVPKSPSSTAVADEAPWQHDSWVMLEGQPAAVEIARIPRRELGFFPRARRKSNPFSDSDTPSTSLDLPRPSITVSDTGSLDSRKTHRPRRSSSSHMFSQQLHGPGGVGSLAGKGPSAPGPSEDKFTKALARHLPGFIPPTSQSPGEEQFAANASVSTLGLENVGSTIEGWMKKLAKSAAKAVETPPAQNQAHKQLGLSAQPGDLIEMSNAFEIGDDEDDISPPTTADDARGRSSGMATLGASAAPSGSQGFWNRSRGRENANDVKSKGD